MGIVAALGATGSAPVSARTVDSSLEALEFDYDDSADASDVYVTDNENVQFAPGHGYRGDNALRISTVANESWGANATFDLTENGYGEPDAVYQSIRFRLDDEFRFSAPTHSCRIFNAGLNTRQGGGGAGSTPGGLGPQGDNGWSVRIYVSSRPDGARPAGPFGITEYTYHMDQPGDVGYNEEIPVSTVSIDPGEWYHLETYVELNTITNGTANDDGVSRIWIDGELIHARENWRWTTIESQGHHRIGPVNHWGGAEVAPRESFVYYDDHRAVIGGIPGDRPR